MLKKVKDENERLKKQLCEMQRMQSMVECLDGGDLEERVGQEVMRRVEYVPLLHILPYLVKLIT